MSFLIYKKNKMNRGFSLLEMLLYITLFSGVILIISTFFVSMLGSKQRNQAVGEVEQQAAIIMDKILFEIRNATGITSPAMGETQNTISMNVTSVPNDPTSFNLSGGDIYINRGGLNPIKLNNDFVTVSNLYFSNYKRNGTTDVISVHFTMNTVNPGNMPELNYSNNYYGTASLKR